MNVTRIRSADHVSPDSKRLDWLAAQLKPGCFYTLNHYEHASQFFGAPPAGWSPETPIGLGEFPEHFGSTLREAIDAAMGAREENNETKSNS